MPAGAATDITARPPRTAGEPPDPPASGRPDGEGAREGGALPSARLSWQVAWRSLWSSRLVVFAAGVLGVLEVGRASGTAAFDPANLTAPFGYFGNLLVSPFARWDSVWYLAIARDGYLHQPSRTAFFPIYPLLTRGLGVVTGSDLVAGIVISFVAFAIGLALLHRLACLDLGADAAATAVTLIAFCPMAYFFSAVYTESLYLALSVGCILRARHGKWLTAGLLGAVAAASRNSGVMLAVPVFLLFLYGPRDDRPEPTSRWARGGFRGWRIVLPRHRLAPGIMWVALIPCGLAAYVGFLALTTHNGLAPFHAESVWFRHFAGPFGGIAKGAVAAWDGLRQVIHGPAPPVYFKLAGGDPLQVAGQNLMLFAFLLLAVAGLIGVARRLPFAYLAYCLASLAMPLSYPVTPQPLASLPRYAVVLFPLFLWGGLYLTRRRPALGPAALATLAVLLGLFTVEFATWRFVA